MTRLRRDNFNTRPLWKNQDLVLYHGTTLPAATAIASGTIGMGYGSLDKDFGQGFYTTTVQIQAESWAKTRVLKREKMGLPYESPALAVIFVPRTLLAGLATLAFTLGGGRQEDFWSFVRHNRSKTPDHRLPLGSFSSSYDVVYGPLVADWESREVFPDRDQVSFHTLKSQWLLNNDAKRAIIEVE